MKFQDLPIGSFFQFGDEPGDGLTWKKTSNSYNDTNNVCVFDSDQSDGYGCVGTEGNADPDWDCVLIPKPPRRSQRKRREKVDLALVYMEDPGLDE